VPSSSGPGIFLRLLDTEDEVTVILKRNQLAVDLSTWTSRPRGCVSQAVLL
jgi:hypothetical protein